jgi:Calcineurin-like phosphoesterase
VTGPGRIIVLGDTHQNTPWVVRQFPAWMSRLAAEETRVILQLGDFGFDPRSDAGERFLAVLQGLLAGAGMQLWFLDGNHENYEALDDLRNLADSFGDPRPASVSVPGFPAIRHLERGCRWDWHGRAWLALGGATSLDRQWRTEGEDWFPQEAITASQALDVAAAGPADVMCTHDCPAAVVHAFPDFGFPEKEIAAAGTHARLLQSVVDQVRPSSLIHGHLHMAYTRPVQMPYGACQVTGLACDGMASSWAVLNTETMTWE